MRTFFGGQTLSYYNQSHGLTNTATGFSVDNNPAVFGTNAAGVATVAPQLPARGYGGFVQLGFPISRWFNAEPKGRNAGWQAYVEYGLDAANANDFYIAKDIGADGAGPIKSNLKAVTVFYKMNPWVQFGFKESNYTLRCSGRHRPLHHQGRRQTHLHFHRLALRVWTCLHLLRLETS